MRITLSVTLAIEVYSFIHVSLWINSKIYCIFNYCSIINVHRVCEGRWMFIVITPSHKTSLFKIPCVSTSREKTRSDTGTTQHSSSHSTVQAQICT